MCVITVKCIIYYLVYTDKTNEDRPARSSISVECELLTESAHVYTARLQTGQIGEFYNHMTVACLNTYNTWMTEVALCVLLFKKSKDRVWQVKWHKSPQLYLAKESCFRMAINLEYKQRCCL